MGTTTLFEQFLSSVECPRCGRLCQLSESENETARPFRRSNDTSRGLCPDCSAAHFLQAGPLAEVIAGLPDLSFLRSEPFQEQFAAVLRAGQSEMDPSEIDWGNVIVNWDLPFPDRRRKR